MVKKACLYIYIGKSNARATLLKNVIAKNLHYITNEMNEADHFEQTVRFVVAENEVLVVPTVYTHNNKFNWTGWLVT
jgi:hypothetical protein